jgi:hypothetical protein
MPACIQGDPKPTDQTITQARCDVNVGLNPIFQTMSNIIENELQTEVRPRAAFSLKIDNLHN